MNDHKSLLQLRSSMEDATQLHSCICFCLKQDQFQYRHFSSVFDILHTYKLTWALFDFRVSVFSFIRIVLSSPINAFYLANHIIFVSKMNYVRGLVYHIQNVWPDGCCNQEEIEQ